ncbi:MAG: glutathione S-transferase family protein [Thalassotalea sp.]
MYQLYTIPGTCSTGIHVLLNKLEIPFEVIKRDDVPNYQSIVPTNQVPALQDQDRLITEGAAIVLHLLAKHPLPHKNTWQEDEFNQWLMFNYATLHPAYSKLFSLLHVTEDARVIENLMKIFAEKLAGTWKIIDDRLAKQTYMVGDEASIIDYLLAVYVRWGNVFPSLSIPVGKNVLRLVNEIKELPEFTKAFAAEGCEYKIPDNAY